MIDLTTGFISNDVFLNFVLFCLFACLCAFLCAFLRIIIIIFIIIKISGHQDSGFSNLLLNLMCIMLL